MIDIEGITNSLVNKIKNKEISDAKLYDLSKSTLKNSDVKEKKEFYMALSKKLSKVDEKLSQEYNSLAMTGLNESKIKKVVRLNEKDIEKLVKKIISEDRKINENTEKDSILRSAKIALYKYGYTPMVVNDMTREDVKKTLEKLSRERFGKKDLDKLASQL